MRALYGDRRRTGLKVTLVHKKPGSVSMGDAEAEQTPVFGICDVHKPFVASGVPQAKRGDH